VTLLSGLGSDGSGRALIIGGFQCSDSRASSQTRRPKQDPVMRPRVRGQDRFYEIWDRRDDRRRTGWMQTKTPRRPLHTLPCRTTMSPRCPASSHTSSPRVRPPPSAGITVDGKWRQKQVNTRDAQGSLWTNPVTSENSEHPATRRNHRRAAHRKLSTNRVLTAPPRPAVCRSSSSG